MDQNFEIAILFRIVENHNNYVFGDDLPPTVPGGGAASYKLWPMFTYSNGYWEVYRRYQGDFLVWVWGSGEGAIWEDLSLEKYFMGEEKYNEKGAGLSSINIKKNNENVNMKKFFQWKVRRSI